MDWSACTATGTLPTVAAALAWLAAVAAVLALCRAAAFGDAHRREPEQPADAPPQPPPRTPSELVACALVDLGVEHATLFAGGSPEHLRVIGRGHIDTRADAEPPELHQQAAAAAVHDGGPVEFGGMAPAPLVAAAPVISDGRPVGALAVSAQGSARGRFTFAERRALGQLAAAAGALPILDRRRRVGRGRP
jgi:hypothetical protein